MKKKRKAPPLRKKVKIKKVSQTSTNTQAIKSKETRPLSEKDSQNFKKLYSELKKRYDFLLAEYANYKRQTIKQQILSKKYEGQLFIKNLIDNVLDDFDRAMNINLTEETKEDFKTGIILIYENLQRLLKEFHIKESPCLKKPFDPTIHSAINSIDTDDIAPEHVVDVLKKAYFLHDKLLRPAEVIVSRPKKSLNTENNNKEDNKEKDNG